MSTLFRFLFGTCTFSFAPERKTDILNFLLENGIGAVSCRTDGDEGRLEVFCKDAKRIPNTVCLQISEQGALVLLRRLWHRPGLIVGGMLMLLLLLVSSLTVWRVEIKGNERFGAVEIESALATAGLSVGDLSPTLDIAAIKNRFLRENPEISWIGIYLRGTTAQIEVREASTEGNTPSHTGFCNLVASADGVIERISVDAGRAVVTPGATVRAGELLISGIYRTATGLRATRAEGSVLARSEETVTVFQALSSDEKQPDTREIDGLWLEFFGKKIKLFKKSGKTDAEYDIIKRKEQIILFNRISLPIFIEQDERITYSTRTVTLNEEQVVRMAFSRLRAEMAARFATAEVVAEQVYAEWTDDGYRLTCRVEYISDIATPLAYDAQQNGG